MHCMDMYLEATGIKDEVVWSGQLPLTHFWCTRCLRALIPSLSSSSSGKVCSRDIQASVIETPYFKPAGPSGGIACFPSLMFDSIMTPQIICDVGPSANCLACNESSAESPL